MQRLIELLPFVRTVWVVVFSALALLSVLRAPVGFLWKPAVGATEAGYLLVLLLLPAFIGGWKTGRDTLLFACGLAAAVLYVSSAWRASRLAKDLPSELRAAFGEQAGFEQAAFSFSQLFHLATPGPAPTTYEYEAEDGTSLQLDYYAPQATSTDRSSTASAPPLVIVIHGGSWSGGDRTQLPAMNRHLAARGYAVAAIEYRLAPDHVYPAQLDDVRAATNWLRTRHDELGFDPERVVLYGRSAGAHLALLGAYTWRADWVKAVVALYPPADLTWSWHHPSNPLVLNTPETLSAFMGGALDESPEQAERYAEASPYTHTRRALPPTLLIHGGRDELVSQEQSRRLAARLHEQGAPAYLLALPWATHGCEANLAGPSGQLTTFAVDWLFAALLDPAPATEPRQP